MISASGANYIVSVEMKIVSWCKNNNGCRMAALFLLTESKSDSHCFMIEETETLLDRANLNLEPPDTYGLFPLVPYSTLVST